MQIVDQGLKESFDCLTSVLVQSSSEPNFTGMFMELKLKIEEED